MNIEAMFQAIDKKDTECFVSFLDEDCLFRFGNFAPVRGQENIHNFVAGFIGTVEALQHEVREIWNLPDAIVCHGVVTYTRQDRSTLSVPFATIFKLKGDRIAEYLIFANNSEL